MIPSPVFVNFVSSSVSLELNRAHPVASDILEARLWSAAQYDCFTRSGAIADLLDGFGLAKIDAAGYEQIIKAGLREYKEAGF